jgi:hypothetical protein
MQRTMILGLTIAQLLLGPPQVFAQVEPNRTLQTEGRSLGTPEHQQQADEAMSTSSGRAGRDEPGVHTQTTNEPVFKNGKMFAPGTPADGQSWPPAVGQRP